MITDFYDPLKILRHDLPLIKKNDVVFLGCSYTSGCGLSDQATNWTSIFSNAIEKNQVNFALNGLNNYSSFDLFSQLEFESDQNVVVLEITELARVQWYNQHLHDIMIQWDHSRVLLPVYNDHFLIFELIKNLRQFMLICKLKNLRSVVWSIARPGTLTETFEGYLAQYPEYVYMDNCLDSNSTYRVDNGSDGNGKPVGVGHPGVKSHQLIAQKLLAHYNQLYNKDSI
jgi:hypothetical protein